jgi:hypothetical protein
MYPAPAPASLVGLGGAGLYGHTRQRRPLQRLHAVISRGCDSIYDGSDAISTSRPSPSRCDVQFNRNLTGCKSVIQPRPVGIGHAAGHVA